VREARKPSAPDERKEAVMMRVHRKGVVGSWVAAGVWLLCGGAANGADLFATSTVSDPDNGWQFEERCIGNSCGDPCTDCNSGTNFTYNDPGQSPPSRDVGVLEINDLTNYVGACAQSVELGVLCRYDSGDSGRYEARILGTGVQTPWVQSTSFVSSTSCEYTTIEAANFPQLVGADPGVINSLRVQIRRVQDGNNTRLRVKHVRVRVTPAVAVPAPPSISVQRSTVCEFDTGSNTLSVPPVAGASVQWFDGACGVGMPVALGPTYTQTPARPGTFLARYTTLCGASACASVTVGQFPTPTAPTSVTATPNSVCNNGPMVTLAATGGSNGTLRWYEGGCGVGAPLGSGPTLVLSPGRPGVFCARVESTNGCPPSPCACVTVGAITGRTVDITASPGNDVCQYTDLTLAAVVTPAGGQPYEWTRNGVLVVNGFTPCGSFITGATGTVLSVQNAGECDAGVYNLRVLGDTCGTAGDPTPIAIGTISPACCDSIDFNNDGVSPDFNDLRDYLSVFGGGPCSTASTSGCNDLDFNNDGVSPDNSDIMAFLSILGGGNCFPR
jgi:hypothetical protein